jgi:hypothetical protein
MKLKLYLYLPICSFFLLSFALQPGNLFWLKIIYPLIFLILGGGALVLVKGNLRRGWPFLLHILICVSSGLAFFLLLDSFIWTLIFILFFSIIIFVLFLTFIRFFYQPRLYRPFQIQRISIWLNFVLIYWICSVIGFWEGGGWSYLILILIFTWLHSYPFLFFPSSPIPKKKILVVILILTEIYISLSFLPWGYFLNALIISFLAFLISFNFNLFKTKA